VDEDYFALGNVESGQTILLGTRLPTGSTLRPIVEIRNAAGEVVALAAFGMSFEGSAGLASPKNRYQPVG
jgi:hypothetical protein